MLNNRYSAGTALSYSGITCPSRASSTRSERSSSSNGVAARPGNGTFSLGQGIEAIGLLDLILELRKLS